MNVELVDRISDHNTISVNSKVWITKEKEINIVAKLMNYSRNKMQNKLRQYDWSEH